jgi:hypothetical protein
VELFRAAEPKPKGDLYEGTLTPPLSQGEREPGLAQNQIAASLEDSLLAMTVWYL